MEAGRREGEGVERESKQEREGESRAQRQQSIIEPMWEKRGSEVRE